MADKKKYPQKITPDYVLSLKKPTEKFLCPFNPSNNIKFLHFKIRNLKTGKILFDTEEERKKLEKKNSKLTKQEIQKLQQQQQQQYQDEDSYRTIKYNFSKKMLQSGNEIGTSLVFSIGDKPVKNFRMIERHYYKDTLLQSFSFETPFCIPKTTNSWECIYKVPNLKSSLVKSIVDHPFETTSDSFYFIDGGELIMHNKAYYKYS